MKDNNKKPAKNGPTNWAGVGTIVGAGVGSFIGLSADHIILYTLFGGLIGLWIGSMVSNSSKN